MQFIIENKVANHAFMKWQTIINARNIIWHHKITPGEHRLNNYLLANYNVDLKAACIYLLGKCKMYRDHSNAIIILFLEKDDDDLAALITYGDGVIKGSKILADAFLRGYQK